MIQREFYEINWKRLLFLMGLITPIAIGLYFYNGDLVETILISFIGNISIVLAGAICMVIYYLWMLFGFED